MGNTVIYIFQFVSSLLNYVTAANSFATTTRSSTCVVAAPMIRPSPPAVAVAWQFTVAFPQPMPNAASAICTTAEVIFATAARRT